MTKFRDIWWFWVVAVMTNFTVLPSDFKCWNCWKHVLFIFKNVFWTPTHSSTIKRINLKKKKSFTFLKFWGWYFSNTIYQKNLKLCRNIICGLVHNITEGILNILNSFKVTVNQSCKKSHFRRIFSLKISKNHIYWLNKLIKKTALYGCNHAQPESNALGPIKIDEVCEVKNHPQKRCI
jgi:hypothetical protein